MYPNKNTSRSFSRQPFRSASRPPRPMGMGGGRPQRRGRFGGPAIDIAAFIRKATVSAPAAKQHVIQHSFADFKFVGALDTNLQKKGYTTPTPVQDQTIPLALAGKDVIGLANTGTGKTAAFLLPLIDKLLKDPKQSVLIMAPTRELALQIEEEFRDFAWGLRLYSAVCVGGMPIFRQIQNLRRNPHFVIGTPGRLMDLNERKVLSFSSFNNVVLDEVDHMLDMGFIEPIKEILAQLPRERQSLFFSATMPPRIRDLTVQFLRQPVTIDVHVGETAANVEQNVIRIQGAMTKFQELQKLLSQPGLSKVLIFSETKRDVERLTRELLAAGFRADSIHGDKKQSQRQRALNQFRENRTTILVATDVAARGLDIKDITHVINYTVPQTHDDYVHRIGRTGRGDSKGVAYTFV